MTDKDISVRSSLVRILPVLMAAVAAMVMVFSSRYWVMPQIMLPTFGALLTGTWLVRSNLWHYNKRRLFISLPAASLAGLLLSKTLAANDYFWVYPSLYVAFLGTAVILIAGKTQIYPCFGAARLPLLFQTTSWLYPLAVFIMAVMLCAGRSFLERIGALDSLNPSGFHDLPEQRRERAIYYLQMSLGLLPALIFVPIAGDHFLLLPPLFVTYASFCNQNSTFTHYPVQTWLQLCVAFFMGSLAYWSLGHLTQELPHVYVAPIIGLAAGVMVVLMVGVGRVFHKLFPPAMSMALTPFLIDFYAPCLVYVPIMAAYFIFVAWLVRTHPAYRSRDLNYM